MSASSIEPMASNDVNDIVLVTGFGPFGEHKINASWEIVKLLPSLNVEKEFDVKLVIQEIPVAYDYVAEKIPALWKAHNPMLVVHVGVSSIATGLTLEQQAHKSGYCRLDVEGKLPPKNECCNGRTDVIQTAFDVEQLVEKEVNAAKIGVPTCMSFNAGRYLCEFVYYTSLNIDYMRTIFIHVPELKKSFSAADLAKALKAILGVLIEQLRERQYKYLDNTVSSCLQFT